MHSGSGRFVEKGGSWRGWVLEGAGLGYPAMFCCYLQTCMACYVGGGGGGWCSNLCTADPSILSLGDRGRTKKWKEALRLPLVSECMQLKDEIGRAGEEW